MKNEFYPKMVYRTHLFPTININNELQQEEFKKALYLASTDLVDAVERNKENGDEQEKTKIPLYKYRSRISNRCTPFGLFSGVGVAQWGENSKIELYDDHQVKLRIDMAYFSSLIRHLLQYEDIIKNTHWTLNNTILQSSDKYTFYELISSELSSQYSIVSLERNKYLDELYSLALKNGKINFADLFNCLQLLDPELGTDEIEEYIFSVFESQLFINEISLKLTNENYEQDLINQLDQILDKVQNIELHTIRTALREIKSQLDNLKNVNDITINTIKIIESLVEQIGIPFQRNLLLQTDLFFQAKNAEVSQSIQSQLADAFKFLSKVTIKQNEELNKFASEFTKRYGDKPVSILKLFSEESGITYPINKQSNISTLLDELTFEAPKPSESSLKVNYIDKLLYSKLQKAIIDELEEIEFTDEDVEKFPANLNFCPTVSLFFSLYPGNKNNIHLISASTNTATGMVARFSYQNNEIKELMKDIATSESISIGEKIYADVIHLAGDRLGNVTLRESPYNYEIPIFTENNDPQKRIPLSDIYVNVYGDKISLWSKRLNKQIIPRLTTAHNFQYNSVPIYHFLSELQNESEDCAHRHRFDWGNFEFMYKSLPRAVYKNVILKEAIWSFDIDDIKEILAEFKSKKTITEFATKWKLPTMFFLADGDNMILVDLNHLLSLEAFCHEIKSKESITITEYIEDKGESLIKNKQGQYFRNEIIAYLKNDTFVPTDERKDVMLYGNFSSQNMSPGSLWSYYKIYMSENINEKILSDNLAPFLEKITNENSASKHFFIRYADPDFHLRIRFLNNSMESKQKNEFKLNTLLDGLLKEEKIWNFQIDTYKREFNRYGISTIEEIESLFHNDSHFFFKYLSKQTAEDKLFTEEDRVYFGVLSAFNLLKSFELSDSQLFEIVDIGYEAFVHEHGSSKKLRHELDDMYRIHRQNLEILISGTYSEMSNLQEIMDILEEKRMEDLKQIHSIREKMSTIECDLNEEKLLSCLIHMSINRLFSTRPRTYELVVYAMLMRALKSYFARLKKDENFKMKVLG